MKQESTLKGYPASLKVNVSHKPIIIGKYEYDLCNQVVKIEGRKETKNLEYDHEGRLLHVESSIDLNSEQFELDANGNCIKRKHGE